MSDTRHVHAPGETEPPLPLSIPSASDVKFERNFIYLAVCELKFPELPSLDTAMIAAIRKRLRKDYPIHERTMDLSPASPRPEGVSQHTFKSKKGDWQVSASSLSIRLESLKYDNFEVFAQRLEQLIEWTATFRDSDFFTRVGLRYINLVPISEGSVQGWVNDALVAPLIAGRFGTPDRYIQEVGGFAAPGRYLFRHGLVPEGSGASKGAPIYLFDFDFYEETVEAERVVKLVQALHQQSFAFFMWAIGPKAVTAMGSSTPKPRSR